MARHPATVTEHVVLNTRTLRIGPQAYQLQNIARVQTVVLEKPRRLDRFLGSLALSLVMVFLVILVGVAFSSPVKSPPAIVILIVALVIIRWIFIKRINRPLPGPLYALLLETTGPPQTVLASFDYAELNRLSDGIVKAIENPPTSPQNYYINIDANTVHGDQYTVKGRHNIGKQIG